MKAQIHGAIDERYRSYSEDISRSGSNLLRIINDILDIATFEAGHLALHVEPVDLDDLLATCARSLRQQAEDAAITLVVAARSDGPDSVAGDYGKLKQILLHLLANAVKFTPGGGRVTVSARGGPAGSVEIEVADTGIGMTEEEIALALQPFRQVDNSHARKYQGTGLGLTLARALAELHRGALEIASEPGRGTTVIVRLPTDGPASAPPAAASSLVECLPVGEIAS